MKVIKIFEKSLFIYKRRLQNNKNETKGQKGGFSVCY